MFTHIISLWIFTTLFQRKDTLFYNFLVSAASLSIHTSKNFHENCFIQKISLYKHIFFVNYLR